jgi:ribulose-phosphate 3-epimerase
MVYSEPLMAGVRIAPSILSSDFARLADEIAAVEKAGADLLHVDVMDGHFVPNLTIGPPIVEAIRKVTSLPLDVHLMITNPNDFIDEFAEAGADYLTVHVEACPHLHRTVQAIKEKGVKAGVTLNPATPLVSIEPILPDVDLLLIMSVNPGFGGQKFINSVLKKIREARAMIDKSGSHALLEVDGGVKVDNAGEIAAAGADILVAGSAIFEVPGCDYRDVIARMRQTASSDAAKIRPDTEPASGKPSAASSRKRQ